METHNHAALKQIGVRWLYETGCRYIATEIKIGRYIYDVVGCDGRRVIVIEAKQDHDDFLRDCNDPEVIKVEIGILKEAAVAEGDLKTYKKEVEKLRDKSTKFFDKGIHKMSTHRYIIAPDDLIEEDELPEEWGLINENRNVKIKCEGHRIDHRYVERMIREIARKQTKLFLESVGVDYSTKPMTWPDIMLI